MQRVLKRVEPITLLFVLAVLFACAYFDLQSATAISVGAVILSTVPFFLRYEMQKPRPRDIMPVVVLAAIASVGRILFAAAPNFKPVSAIVILCGIYFGRQNGFLCGALSALASNMFFGQGVWLPWQMYAWGMMGYVAGVLHDKGVFKKNLFVVIYGAIASFLYGVLLDLWFVVSFAGLGTQSGALVALLAGVPFNISHAVSTIFFLLFILVPWGKKLQRLKDKYGIMA